MTILFLGGSSMSRFTPLDSNAYESTDAAGFKSDINDFAIKVASAHSGVETEHWTDEDNLWFHACQYMNAVDAFFTSAASIRFYSSAGVEVARLLPSYPGLTQLTYSLYTLQSGVLTLVGSTTVTQGAIRTLDINIVGNSASGSAAFYIEGTQKLSVSSLNHAGFAGIAYAQLKGSISGGSPVAYWSEVAAADESLIGLRLSTKRPTGNSATNLGYGAGDFSSVDEITYSDVDGITSTAANEVRTFTWGNTNPNNWAIRAVGVSDRVKAGASGPQNEQKALRIGGSNYFSATKALTPGYSPRGAIWETDPSTAAEWATLPTEFGAKSIT